jgi:hypothetical protein
MTGYVVQRPPAFTTCAEMSNWHHTQIAAACKAHASTEELLSVLVVAVGDLLTAVAVEEARRRGV